MLKIKINTIKVTKNYITEIKVGKGYDKLEDVTTVVNMEE